MSLRAAEAKANWEANCAQCHGKSGAADTKMGKQLNAKNLTDPRVQAAFSDAKATQSIKEGVKENGKTTMKGFGQIDRRRSQSARSLRAHAEEISAGLAELFSRLSASIVNRKPRDAVV